MNDNALIIFIIIAFILCWGKPDVLDRLLDKANGCVTEKSSP